MGLGGCPGAKLFKDITPEYFDCPFWTREIEIWSDELLIKCPHCRTSVSRQRGASCIDWCLFARDCVGAQKYEQLQAGRGDAQPAGVGEKTQG